MEIVLNKQKGIKNNIDNCYEEVDHFFNQVGAKKLKQGVYYSPELMTIMKGQFYLPCTPWFLKVVDTWYCRYESDDIEDREDALESLYRIDKPYGNFNKKSD